MLQTFIQQQAQSGNNSGMQWGNPQLQQQMLQQYQQRMLAMQNGGSAPAGTETNTANAESTDGLNGQRTVDV